MGNTPWVNDADEIWIPLVDEPIGSIVQEIQETHPEIAALVAGGRNTLAFRTFAYIRVGMLLGQLLVERDVPRSDDDTWVEAFLSDPEVYDQVVNELRAVAEEVAGDRAELVEPDEETRERFRAFARKQLG